MNKRYDCTPRPWLKKVILPPLLSPLFFSSRKSIEATKLGSASQFLVTAPEALKKRATNRVVNELTSLGPNSKTLARTLV